MITGPYGRQWIHPSASFAFAPKLLSADRLCITGDAFKALSLYKKETECGNHIAKRRLNIAQKQLRLAMKTEDLNEDIEIIRIGFIDWYQGFNNDQSNLLRIFENAGLNIEVTKPEEADLIIAGCYDDRIIKDPLLTTDKLVIFVSGENISPSYNIHDFSLTSRSNSYCGKNARFAQWLGELITDKGGIGLREHKKYLYREVPTRDLFITAIYNNSTPEREEAVTLLRNAFGKEKVNVFGSQRTGEINKFEILARSNINLCFENSLGNGYITEKLLHAKIMGCKALYWGDKYYIHDFSGEGVMNTSEINSFDVAVKWCEGQIERFTRPPQSWWKIDESIFTKPPTYREVEKSIARWSKIILTWRSLRY